MDLSVTEPTNPARTPAPPLETLRIQYDNRQSFALAPLATTPRSTRRWVPLALLFLITLFGGILRFYRITYPALWNDETLVYWRVCGTYGQMLQPLSLDGFPPLHYSLYWLLGHVPVPNTFTAMWLAFAECSLILMAFLALLTSIVLLVLRPSLGNLIFFGAMCWIVFTAITRLPNPVASWPDLQLTPFVMRFVPAISGTLTIPAIYFLARQMLPKSTSLLAAAFTACSAFMLFYSRDAKMYPDVWLFITLNIACMLWWFRTSNSTAFLCWIAAGCAMVGLHASAFAIPVVSLLMFFTQRRLTWQKTVLFTMGLIVIASGPVVYATKFNHWTERVEEEGWGTSGIGWVNGFYNGNRTGPDHVLYTTAAFLTAYEWPRDDYLTPKYDQPILEPLREIPQTAFKEVIWILAIGIFPWSFFFRRQAVNDPAPEPAWRTYFWLGSWILVCGYGAYCYSVRNFESPRRWTYELQQGLGVYGLAITIAIVIGFTLLAITHRRLRTDWACLAKILLATAALFGICYVMFLIAWPMAARAEFGDNPWQSVWTPRYLGFIWPAFGIACAALLMRLPTRAIRIACSIFVLAINLGAASMRFTLGTEPPIEQLAHDLWLSQDPKSTIRTFNLIRAGDRGYAGTAMNPDSRMATGRYYLEMESHREPMSPDLFVDSYNQYKMHSNPDFANFKKSIATSPQLKDVIIWTLLTPPQLDGRPHELTFDPYGKLLGPKWKMTSEQVFTVHNYWDWRERWKWVRREYVKK